MSVIVHFFHLVVFDRGKWQLLSLQPHHSFRRITQLVFSMRPWLFQGSWLLFLTLTSDDLAKCDRWNFIRFTPESPASTKYGFINAEARQSVIFLLPNSVDCICCDDLSLVSAVSSISASVSALLLPALCLMCAPCIMTVVDFSCYGRSDSTRRPSLAILCKHRPRQRGVVWGTWGWWLGLDGLDCGDDDNERFGFFSFLQA